MNASVTPVKPKKERTRATSLLLGCLGGCGILSLILVSSCVGFVWWLNRPGEMLVPEHLRGLDTTAHVEWTLRLEDPGTELMVEDILKGLRELQDLNDSPLPPAVSGLLTDYQSRRNERQFRQLFPLVAAWTVVGDERPGEDLHLFTVGIENLGNRMVLIDWVMGMLISRSPDLDVIRHGGEKIYRIEESGSAFFLRRSNFILATELETAKRAVDRLNGQRDGDNPPTGIERLLSRVPADSPLKGASLNENDEVHRFFDLLTGGDDHETLDRLDWAAVSGMTIEGGFTERSSFAARIDLLVPGTAWTTEQLEVLRTAIAGSLSGDSLKTAVEVVSRPDRVELRIEFDDLPAVLRHRVALGDDS